MKDIKLTEPGRARYTELVNLGDARGLLAHEFNELIYLVGFRTWGEDEDTVWDNDWSYTPYPCGCGRSDNYSCPLAKVLHARMYEAWRLAEHTGQQMDWAAYFRAKQEFEGHFERRIK